MAFQLRVRWSEVDAQGVVFNANYLLYADIAVNEHMRSVGVLEMLGSELRQVFVINAELTFHASARFDDLIDFNISTRKLGRSSHTVEVQMFRAGERLCTVTLTYVRAMGGKSVPLSPDYRRLVQETDSDG